MTEEKAKTKWCPYAVASHTNPRRGFDAASKVENAYDHDTEHEFPCIGSECMAWRTLPNNLSPKDRGYSDKIRGFCGLAGKP